MIEAKEHYPIKESERAFANMLKDKHWQKQAKLSRFDQGRLHAAIYITAMLKHNGQPEAAEMVNKFLDWLADHKPEKAALSK